MVGGVGVAACGVLVCAASVVLLMGRREREEKRGEVVQGEDVEGFFGRRWGEV